MANDVRRAEGVTWGGFGLRFILASLLVLATYNPSGYSFADWVWDAWNGDGLGPVHYLAGVVLLIGWIVLIQATLNSLGPLGLLLGAALLGALVWLLFDLGVLAGSGVSFYTWIVEVCLGALLAVGLVWSHLWRRLTGQVDVDDFDGR